MRLTIARIVVMLATASTSTMWGCGTRTSDEAVATKTWGRRPRRWTSR